MTHTYYFRVTETVRRTITVQAPSERGARQKIRNGEVLFDGDFEPDARMTITWIDPVEAKALGL